MLTFPPPPLLLVVLLLFWFLLRPFWRASKVAPLTRREAAAKVRESGRYFIFRYFSVGMKRVLLALETKRATEPAEWI